MTGGQQEAGWAERRDLVADDRDATADTREAEANAREAEADAREAQADALEVGWQDGDRAAQVLIEEARAVRAQARHIRQQAALRRHRATQQRQDAARHRLRGAQQRRRAADELDPDQWLSQHPLAAQFAELAERLFTADDLPDVVNRIVATAPDLLPGTDLASVTVLDPEGRFRTPASTDPLAGRLDDAQYRADQGPCLDATRRDGLGIAGCHDLTNDPPWPAFAATALRLGVRSVLSVGLFPHAQPPRLGALNLYARQPGALSDTDQDAAVVLAAHLATALVAQHHLQRQHDTNLGLRQALKSRDVIGQAKGILMARRGVTADEAFAMLSTASQRLNTKLRDLADRLTHGSPLPAGPPAPSKPPTAGGE